jgi:hypothetical protein
MKRYNLSKIIFILLIGVLVSTIGVAFPVLQNAFIGNSLIKRNIIFSDIIGGMLLHCISAFLGALTGAFVHPRILKNRKLAVLLALSIALIGYTSGVIAENIPVTRIILWLFPPVYPILESFNGYEYFNMHNIIFPLFYGSIYCIILISVQIQLLKRNRF